MRDLSGETVHSREFLSQKTQLNYSRVALVAYKRKVDTSCRDHQSIIFGGEIIKFYLQSEDGHVVIATRVEEVLIQ